MNPQTPQFYVIIVHYGEPATTRRAVRSLLDGSVRPKTILVVDHAKEKFVYDGLPQVHILRPMHNEGYAAGINLGLGALTRHSVRTSDVVIAMNNDVEVQPDTLLKLQQWWTAHPYPALRGVVSQEGTSKIYGGGHIHLWTGRAHLNTTRHQPVHYVHGAFLVAPYDVFLKTQGLPEHYFLYWEDVLFGRRVQARHIPLEIVPHAFITHRTATADTISDQQLYYLVRNGALFLEKELPWPWRMYWNVRNRLRALYHGSRRGRRARVIYQALTDARRGVMSQAPHSSLAPNSYMSPAAQAKGDHLSPTPSCAAVVVTYNSAGSIERCIASLQDNGISEIVVVDNASTDNTVSIVRQLSGVHTITLISHDTNKGFGAACNVGAAGVTSPLILFLNPDAYLHSNSLELALAYFSRHPTVGVVGLSLREQSGKQQLNNFGPEVTLWSLITRKLVYQKASTHPVVCGWVSGGAMIVRTSAFVGLGGFDTRYFLYWEDVDLCKRLRHAGWKVVWLPTAHAGHDRGQSLLDNRRKTELYDSSADRYFRTHYATAIWLLQRYSRKIFRLFSSRVS